MKYGFTVQLGLIGWYERVFEFCSSFTYWEVLHLLADSMHYKRDPANF